MKKQQIGCYLFALQALKTFCQVMQNNIFRVTEALLRSYIKQKIQKKALVIHLMKIKSCMLYLKQFCKEMIKHHRIDEFRSIRQIVDEQADKLSQQPTMQGVNFFSRIKVCSKETKLCFGIPSSIEYG